MYVFTATWKTVLNIIIVIFAENASLRSYSIFIYLCRTHILTINMRTYITSAHGYELSVGVRADSYNLL